MRYIAGIIALAALMSACGSSSSEAVGQRGPGGRAAANRLAAQRAAASDVKLLKLPHGAVRVASEPRALQSNRGFPTGKCFGAENVDERDTACTRQWWIVPGTPERVLAWVAAHSPSAWWRLFWASLPALGRGSGEEEAFAVPGLAHVLGRGEMTETVARETARSTVVLESAREPWLIPAPPSDHTPAGLRVAEVLIKTSGFGPTGPTGPRVASVHNSRAVINDPAQVHTVARLLDGMSAWESWNVLGSCPPGARPILLTLILRASSQEPALEKVATDLGGCAPRLRFGVTIHGHTQPPLWDAGNSLVPFLGHVLGARLYLHEGYVASGLHGSSAGSGRTPIGPGATTRTTTGTAATRGTSGTVSGTETTGSG